jgi:hypothetical protein
MVPVTSSAFVVHEIHQQLTPKMWENFIHLFAYEVGYMDVTRIVNSVLFTYLIVCTAVLHVRRWKKL